CQFHKSTEATRPSEAPDLQRHQTFRGTRPSEAPDLQRHRPSEAPDLQSQSEPRIRDALHLDYLVALNTRPPSHRSPAAKQTQIPRLPGRCVITVQLADEELAEDGAVSRPRLLRGGVVTLCSASRGPPEDLNPGHVTPLGEHRFSFVQDLAFDMAQFLVSTAGRSDGLDGALAGRVSDSPAGV
ncbi:hypothetical protein KUCAC02_013280, partial [Chaenocephalus aceratus]